METRVVASAIQVIRAERARGIARLVAEEPEYGYAEWLHNGEPFIRDLCLTLLVAVRHQLERELLQLAARTTSDGRVLDSEEYRQRIQEERAQLKNREGWTKLVARLKLEALVDWRWMETLRRLVNSFKHNPEALPDDELLSHLGLEVGVPYAPIAESQALEDALSASLGLNDSANFCDIAEEVLYRVRRFLDAATQAQSKLSRVKRNPLSLDPDSWPR